MTIMEPDDMDSLVEIGDYSETLSDYEDLLAQGAIQW